MSMEIPISDRSRKYGYLFWTKKMEPDVQSFLGKRQKIEIWFEDSYLGEKNIDWTHRRISIGYARTRDLSKKIKSFNLNVDDKGALKIKCK